MTKTRCDEIIKQEMNIRHRKMKRDGGKKEKSGINEEENGGITEITLGNKAVEKIDREENVSKYNTKKKVNRIKADIVLPMDSFNVLMKMNNFYVLLNIY